MNLWLLERQDTNQIRARGTRWSGARNEDDAVAHLHQSRFTSCIERSVDAARGQLVFGNERNRSGNDTAQ